MARTRRLVVSIALMPIALGCLGRSAHAADLNKVSWDWVAKTILTGTDRHPNGSQAEMDVLDVVAQNMTYTNLGATTLGGKPRFPTDSSSRYRLSILVLETCADHVSETLDIRLSEVQWFEDDRGLHVDDKSFD